MKKYIAYLQKYNSNKVKVILTCKLISHMRFAYKKNYKFHANKAKSKLNGLLTATEDCKWYLSMINVLDMSSWSKLSLPSPVSKLHNKKELVHLLV